MNVEKRLLLLCCGFGVVMPVLTALSQWLSGRLVTVQMAVQGMLFFLCMAILGYTPKAKMPLMFRWVAWTRKSRIHLLVSPLFLMALGSLLNPYKLENVLNQPAEICLTWAFSYIALLAVLWLGGWDHSSPDWNTWLNKKRKEGENR